MASMAGMAGMTGMAGIHQIPLLLARSSCGLSEIIVQPHDPHDDLAC